MPQRSPKAPHQLHIELKGRLPAAVARSRDVVVIFVDIRGFSKLVKTSDPNSIGAYLGRAFTAILDDYFPNADFFKTTGDGLLIIHELPSEGAAIVAMVSPLLRKCLDLVEAFPTITANSIRITIGVPEMLGVGVARGTVSRLESPDGMILDYTGHCLNLAARLMDKARPSGVVFSDRHAETFTAELTKPIVSDAPYPVLPTSEFHQDRVYIRGISEEELEDIWVSDSVVVPPEDREPPPSSDFAYGSATNMAVEELRDNHAFGFYLPRWPRSFETCGVQVQVPQLKEDRKRTGRVTTFNIEAGHIEDNETLAVFYAELERVHSAIKELPTHSKGLLWDSAVSIQFIPYVRPKQLPKRG